MQALAKWYKLFHSFQLTIAKPPTCRARNSPTLLPVSQNGDRTSMDPTLVRDGNGASTPSGSPGWPSGSRPNGNNNRAESSPTRRSSGKKRSFGESETADQGGSHSTSIGNQRDSPGYLASSQPSRPRPSATGNNIIGGETNSFPEPSAFANSFGLDPTLEADRWLEFSECFK